MRLKRYLGRGGRLQNWLVPLVHHRRWAGCRLKGTRRGGLWWYRDGLRMRLLYAILARHRNCRGPVFGHEDPDPQCGTDQYSRYRRCPGLKRPGQVWFRSTRETTVLSSPPMFEVIPQFIALLTW